jgi:ERCC4-related helicase
MNSIIEQLDKALYNAVSGNTSAFDTYINFMEIRDSLEEHIATIKSHAMDEAIRYNGQQHRGYEIKVGSVGGRYSYDHIPEYVELKEQLKGMESSYQDAFKQYEKGLQIVTDDGELMPVANYKPNAVSIQLKKKL